MNSLLQRRPSVRPRRPIRVAHVVLGLDVGGMEKLLVEFARHADRGRFALHFVALAGRGRVADDLEASGWPVTILDAPAGLRPGLVRRLAQLFRRWKIDVVHTHNTKPLLYAAPAARLAGVPAVVQTRHGQPYRASQRKVALVRLAARLADRVVCVSEDSARLTAEHGVAQKRLATFWNGIDVSRFRYAGPPDTGPVVTVARLSPEKDLATLLRAAAVCPEPTWRLEIAGDGPCRPALEALARDLRLSTRVQFCGEVRDIPKFLARGRLFVLPSLTEGISLTLLEAMAVGLPVVATAVGGNPEVVMHGRTGYLVPAQDATALAAMVSRVLQDPAGARELGRQGRRRVEDYFDVRRMVRRYEALYAELLGAPETCAR